MPDDDSSTSSEDIHFPGSPTSPSSPNSLRRRKKGKGRVEDANKQKAQRRAKIRELPPVILGEDSEVTASLLSPPPPPTLPPPPNSAEIATGVESANVHAHMEDVQLHTGATTLSWGVAIIGAFLAAFIFPIGFWGGALLVTGGGFCGSRLGILSARRWNLFRQLYIMIGRWLENSHILERLALRWMHLVLPPDNSQDPKTLHDAITRSKQQNSGIHTISSIIALTAGGVTFFSSGLIIGLLIGVSWFSFTEIVGTSYLGFVRFAARLNAARENSIACIGSPIDRRIAIAKRSLAPSTPLCFYLAHIGELGKYLFRVGAILPILPFSRSLPSSARFAVGAMIADAIHDFAVASNALHHGVMPENIPDVVRARSLKYGLLKATIYATCLTLISCGAALGFIFGYHVEMSAVTNTTITMVALGTFVFWLAVSYFFLARLDNFFSRVFHRIGEKIATVPWIARRREAAALEEMRILFDQTETHILGSAAMAAAILAAPNSANAEPQRQPLTKQYIYEIVHNNLQEVFIGEKENVVYLRINPAFEPRDPKMADIINAYKNRYFVFDFVHSALVTVVDDLPPEAAMNYGSSAAGPSGVRIMDVTDEYDAMEAGLGSPSGGMMPPAPPPTPVPGDGEEEAVDSDMTAGEQPTAASSSSSSSTNRQLALFFQEQCFSFEVFKDGKATAERELKVIKYFHDYYLPRKQIKQMNSYEISLEDFFAKEEEERGNSSSTLVARIMVFNDAKEDEKKSQDEEEEQEVEELMRIKQEENLVPEEAGYAYHFEPPKKPDKLPEKEMMPTFWNFGFGSMDAIMLLGILTLPFNKAFSYH